MKILSKLKPPQGGTSHAEKIKNIERVIIADFKNLKLREAKNGFSKPKSVKSRRVSQSHNQ
ncbi:hypothetical protein HpBT156_14190 [Helicobacter pylori]